MIQSSYMYRVFPKVCICNWPVDELPHNKYENTLVGLFMLIHDVHTLQYMTPDQTGEALYRVRLS